MKDLLKQSYCPGFFQTGNSSYSVFSFLRKLYRYREVIWAMAARDVLARYAGTFGGIVWAIVHPLATIIIYWFVFSVGFKAQGPSGMPFVVYFVSGLVPWLLFSEVLTSSINAVTANAHLVKKTVFPVEVLPLVHLISGSFAHVIMLGILSVLAWYYGYTPSLAAMQIIYYYGALGFLVLGLSWLFASLQVFHRDIAPAMSVVIGLWFWLTPVIWTSEMIPAQFVWVLQYNPLYYIVEGYRAALVTGRAVFDLDNAFRFWCITGPVVLLGGCVFRKLKPDFADVL